MAGPISLRYDFQDDGPSFCDDKLGEARLFESWNDPRAEGEYQRALAAVGYQCPEAFRDYGWHLSRDLKFREGAQRLQTFINLTPVEERNVDQQDVNDLLAAAQLKERVDSSAKPELDDLLKLTHEVAGYGRRHSFDALPYAEKAVELYPNSAAAFLSLANTVAFKPTDYRSASDRQRLLELLNHAVEVESGNPMVYSARGMFYLDVSRRNERQRSEDAEKDFRMALSLSNNADPDAWMGMGYLHLFRGQKRDALAAFRKYMSLTKQPSYDVTQRIEILDRFPH